MTPIMGCGCAANATDQDGNPTCVIHVGIHPGAATVASVQPNLTGRTAKCNCGSSQPSSRELAFFQFKGEGSNDAINSCKNCHYHLVAHLKPERSKNVCANFEAHGAFEHDEYYCGCRGWD